MRRKQRALHLWNTFTLNTNDTGFGSPSSTHLGLFVSHLALLGKTPDNIKYHVSTVGEFYLHNYGMDPRRTGGAYNRLLPDTPCPRLRHQIQGIEKRYGKPVKLKPPITPNIFRTLLTHLDQINLSYLEQTMFRAASTTALFGLMRVGEYTSKTTTTHTLNKTLLRKHVEFVRGTNHKLTCMWLTITKGKTDASGKGVRLRIPTSGDPGFCPVTALHIFYLQTSRYNNPNEPLFRIGKRNLTRDKINRTIKKLTAAAHLNTNYTSHGYRVGGATALAALGYTVEQIRLRGRWASDCFRVYTREHGRWQEQAAHGFATMGNLSSSTLHDAMYNVKLATNRDTDNSPSDSEGE